MNARRAAALLEVLGVSVVGPLLMFELRRLVGISVTNPLNSLSAHVTNAELITGSRQMFVLLMFQYAGYFLLIFPINWWYRRRGAAAYGLTRGVHSWKMLLLAGLGAAAWSTWPALSVSLVNSLHPSETAPWRQALFDMSWRRWEFWLFSGVMSWALIPLLEELFYRGYCLRRLAEDWGDGPAIIGSACLFTFAHTQYLVPNAYSAGMIASLLTFAIGFGVVFAWTRSLIPSIIAHAIINVVMTPPWQGALLVAFVIGMFITWRRGVAMIRQVFSNASAAACAALAVVGAGYAIMAARDEPLVYVAAAGAVVLAVGLEAMDRRRNRHVTETLISA
ncbi:MAG: CPBP family intramembrane metalloprotease [Acidobacteriota bacterium]|nr:CPBP family intramembrane metalloprotease [Acidobacteriota bacterium]